MAPTSFSLILIGIAGGMALLLGIVGIYRVLAYAVIQRRHEVGSGSHWAHGPAR